MAHKRLADCETAYSRNLCDAREEDGLIRFSDAPLPDMYDHNFTLFTGLPGFGRLHQAINSEIARAKGEGRDFCLIRFNGVVRPVPLLLQAKPQVTRLGFYSSPLENLSIESRAECSVPRVADEDMARERTELELAEYGHDYGYDFCRRKGERMNRAYLSPVGLFTYICRAEGETVGICDLFVHEGVAKLEEFVVKTGCRNRGYGTALLKKLVEDAAAAGADTVYLVTDEDDTAREMYQKLDFSKVWEQTELMFILRT